MRHRGIGGETTHAGRASRSTRVFVPGAALALSLALAAIALGAKSDFTVSGGTQLRSVGEQIVVDAHGDTLYALSPETVHHLLCKSKECFKFWPPLTVSSHKAKLKAGAGVEGKLGLLRRKRGVFQVTLRGMPLYRFAGDHAPGETNGQGIKGFGGTWFAATASPIVEGAIVERPAARRARQQLFKRRVRKPERELPVAVSDGTDRGDHDEHMTSTTSSSTTTKPTNTDEHSADSKAIHAAARDLRR